jgi:hypothetical protein
VVPSGDPDERGELRRRGGNESFVWTSHPWLLYSYLQNETGTVTQQQIGALEDAIRRGDIQWHANPMNMQSEAAERRATWRSRWSYRTGSATATRAR